VFLLTFVQLNSVSCFLVYIYLLAGVSVDETETLILPELVELTNDEHSHVRLAGLDTIVNILSLLDNGQWPSVVLTGQ